MFSREAEFRRGWDDLRFALWCALAPVTAPSALSTPSAPSARSASSAWLLSEAVGLEPRVSGPAGPSDGSDHDLATSSEADEAVATRLIALVELARGGDSEAFGMLYDHYHVAVYRFIYYRVGSVALAEDITSETFFRALRSMGSFRWQGKDFGAWLMTIARNLTTDHFKAGRTRLEYATEDMTPHDGATEGPETSVLAYPHQPGPAAGADRAAPRAAGVPHHAVPPGPLDRGDRAGPGAHGRCREAAPAARRPQPGQAATGRSAVSRATTRRTTRKASAHMAGASPVPHGPCRTVTSPRRASLSVLRDPGCTGSHQHPHEGPSR